VAHPVAGEWIATLVELSSTGAVTDRRPCRAVLDDGTGGLRVAVDWPDGAGTATRLPPDPVRPAGEATWQQRGPAGPPT
jgi:hypothetical protein